MSDVAPCLWLANEAEDAGNFYVTAFHDGGRPASVEVVCRYGADAPMPQDTVLMVQLSLSGQELSIINGGHAVSPSPAVSLIVKCRDQADVDHFWSRLGEGGKPGQCGWLEDRYGVFWQVAPVELLKMIQDADPVRRGRVMKAFTPMTKLDIATIRRAYDGD